MGELSFELMSSNHRDYCRNDRWKQSDRLLYLSPNMGEGGLTIWRWLCDHLPVAARSPNGDPPAIGRFFYIGRRSAGARAVIDRSPGGGRRIETGKNGHLHLRPADRWAIARRWSAGDRWASHHSASRSWKSDGDLPMCKLWDRAKIRQKSGGHRGIYNSCDVAFITYPCKHSVRNR